MRKSRAAAIRNRAQRSALRTALKRASGSGSAEEKLAAVKLLDRAARKGLIHRNAAARHKSQLARAGKKPGERSLKTKGRRFGALFFTSWPTRHRIAHSTTRWDSLPLRTRDT